MICLVCVLLSAYTQGLRTGDLVRGISPKQAVEVGSSVELECRLGFLPDRAEVAWVRVKGVGEVEYLSIYNREEGTLDYDEEQFSSAMSEDRGTWGLIISHVSRTMGGLYQCQVCRCDSFRLNWSYAGNRCKDGDNSRQFWRERESRRHVYETI